MTRPVEFVDCTTSAVAKRHLSLKPTAQWGLAPLCDTAARGYDQAWVTTTRWRKLLLIADLPLCKQCEKSRNRLMEGRRS